MLLEVPPLPRVVRDGVFDAWSWCESDVLDWRLPASATNALDTTARVDARNPAGLAFVMHAPCIFLPRELARLHAFGYGLTDEQALAPYAIDDATDLLYEHRVRPRDVFWLAARSLDALVWGLHDWAHFHNHGPFDDPPTTELQCDLIALGWLRSNCDRIGLSDEIIARVAGDLAALSHGRFAEAGARPPFDLEETFSSYPSSAPAPRRSGTAGAGRSA